MKEKRTGYKKKWFMFKITQEEWRGGRAGETDKKWLIKKVWLRQPANNQQDRRRQTDEL